MKRKSNWLQQLVSITNNGARAFAVGLTLEDNPYKDGYRNQNGPGGQLQRQRRLAWAEGWKKAAHASRNKP